MHCREDTEELAGLTRVRIEGLTTVKRRPPSGWRDAVALLGTAFGVIGMGSAGVLLTRSAAGLLLAPAFGLFGYTKQYWKTALKRRPRLAAVPPPTRPDGEVLVGVARPFERVIGTNALAIATTIESTRGVIVRGIEMAPFWLALADKRVLVTGVCWLASPTPVRDERVADAMLELDVKELPIARAHRRKLRVARVTIAAGDRICVIGLVREEQLAGGGGYRDSLVETVRGEPGHVVWIDRLDAARGSS